MIEWEAKTSIHMLRSLAGAQVEKLMDDQGHNKVG